MHACAHADMAHAVIARLGVQDQAAAMAVLGPQTHLCQGKFEESAVGPTFMVHATDEIDKELMTRGVPNSVLNAGSGFKLQVLHALTMLHFQTRYQGLSGPTCRA